MKLDFPGRTRQVVEHRKLGISWLLAALAKRDRAYELLIRNCTAALFLALTPGAAIYASEASADEKSTPVFQDELKSGGAGPKLIMIPTGSFNRGGLQQGELPSSVISIASFAIGVHEVTRGEYGACVAAGACAEIPFASEDRWIVSLLGVSRTFDNKKLTLQSEFDRKFGSPNPERRARRLSKNYEKIMEPLRARAQTELRDHPQVFVSWHDAQKYARWLTRETGNYYRLPNEAEWEFAARGGSTQDFANSSSMTRDQANYGLEECCASATEGEDKWALTAPVGSFPPNAFGLFDVHGNVWEWVQDCYRTNYAGSLDGRTATGKSCERVLRGGNWMSTARMLRVGARGHSDAYLSTDGTGFRIARDLGGVTSGEFRSTEMMETELGGVDSDYYLSLSRKEIVREVDEKGNEIEFVVFDLTWIKEKEPAPEKGTTIQGVLYFADRHGRRRVALPWTREWSPALLSPLVYFQEDTGFPLSSFGKAEKWIREVNPTDMDVEFVPDS